MIVSSVRAVRRGFGLAISLQTARRGGESRADKQLLARVLCRQCTSSGPAKKVLNVAVVGSGPSAFYTARTLVRRLESVQVDIIEKLPVPFGLVRYGVAPDHPEVKNVISEFEQVLDHPHCRFLGNVSVGQDVSLQELREMYHAVILAYGAADDRNLGIEGEELGGCMSARSFVNWYNAHPDYSQLKMDLSQSESAVVIGNGNVALDVARILLRPIAELEKTDIADYALEALSKSRIKHVHVIGRRGPSQAAWTTAELRELSNISGSSVVMQSAEVALDPIDEEAVGKVRAKKRGMILLNEILARSEVERREGAVKEKQLHIRFLLSPVKVQAAPCGKVIGSLQLEKNRLQGPAERREVMGTGVMEEIPCDLLLRSVGYRSVPLEGLPWDARTHTVPNKDGRVVGPDAEGLYVTGWLRRGPTGIIGSNIMDGQGVAQAVIDDVHRLAPPDKPRVRPGGQALQSLLEERGHLIIDTSAWRRIAAAEKARATAARPVRKIASISELLKAAM